MTDEEAQVQKERIQALFERWRNVLGLDEWEMRLVYRDAPYVDGNGEVRSTALGCTEVEWEYRRAIMYYRVDMTIQQDDDELEYSVVHEAMHVLLNGQRPVTDNPDGIAREYRRLFEEHTATTLALAFIRARKMEQETAA